MLIRGVTRDDLMAAADVASMALGNELVVYDLRPANRSQTAWRLRLKVADLDKPGARLHLRDYYFGVTERPRRSRHACCHAHGAFYTAVFERNEHAVIETAHARYRGARDFLCAYPVVLDRNIGSMMFPIRFGDCCACHSDLIETDSIEYVGYETFIPNGGASVKGG